MSKWREALLALYIISGVAAFGHSAAGHSKECGTEQAVEAGGCIGGAAIGGMIAAFLNPLYWSWEAFDGRD